jgi:hypothetical protein
MHGNHLIRVLPVAKDSGDGRVQLLAVEMYDDGLILRWMRRSDVAPVQADGDEREPLLGEANGFIVTDDAGTIYRFGRGHAEFGRNNVGRGSYHGITQFDPAVPSSATKLLVSYGASAPIEITLSAMWAPRPARTPGRGTFLMPGSGWPAWSHSGQRSLARGTETDSLPYPPIRPSATDSGRVW